MRATFMIALTLIACACLAAFTVMATMDHKFVWTLLVISIVLFFLVYRGFRGRHDQDTSVSKCTDCTCETKCAKCGGEGECSGSCKNKK